jgi:hypothetical protein
MKLKLKIFLVLFAGIAIAYTACKKSGSTTSNNDPSLTPDVVAGQIAVNIYQSLFGGLGAFDVSGGLNAPATLGVHANDISGGLKAPFSAFGTQSKAKFTTSLAGDLTCGKVIDTTLSVTGASNGGTATITGSIKFNYTCANNIVSGFTTDDNLTIVLASPSLNLSYKVGENLTMVSSNPINPDANLTLNGSLTSNGSYQFNTGTKRSGTEVFDYTLTSLIISPALGDVVSGTATFTTSGTGPKGVWNYTGSIVFLGNHLATVTINGKAYNVNLQTGAVS